MHTSSRFALLGACVAAAALGACGDGSRAREVIPPAASVPAPARLTTAGVMDPPAPAPTAPGTYASMTPPFMQHTPPRPKTRAGTPRADSLPVAPTSP